MNDQQGGQMVAMGIREHPAIIAHRTDGHAVGDTTMYTPSGVPVLVCEHWPRCAVMQFNWDDWEHDIPQPFRRCNAPALVTIHNPRP